MQQAIINYTNGINDHLNEVRVNTDPSGAFADEGMQEAVKAFVGGVMAACQAYTTHLLSFVTLLEGIKETYQVNQAAQTQVMDQAAIDAASKIDAYEGGAVGTTS
jgi:hypothetical protein